MTIRLSILTPLVLGLTAVWLSGLSQAAPQRGGGKVSPTLTVTVSPSTIAEGQTATGTVSRVNVTNTDSAVVVTLSSSDTSEATVNASVTIPIGAINTTFTVTGVNDGTGDGAKTVTITAAATGFKSGSVNVTAATPVLPPVRYQIHFFDQLDPDSTRSMNILGTNNLGQAVGADYAADGTSRAIIYDPMIDPTKVVDLNTIVDPETIPFGWRIRNATSINSWGQIAATIAEIGKSARQAVMIDMNGYPQRSPQLHIIPVEGLTDYESGGRSETSDINEFGDILGTFLRNSNGTRGVYVYNFGFLDPLTPIDLGVTAGNFERINNPTTEHGTQVVGSYFEIDDLGRHIATAYRITLGLEQKIINTEFFPPVVDPSGNLTHWGSVNDINDVSDFGGIGQIRFFNKKGIGNASERLGWMRDSSGTLSLQASGRELKRLNEASDFVTSDIYNGELFHRNWGYLSPLALLDTTDPDSATLQGSRSYVLSAISDRDVTGFPQLFGIAEFDDPSSPFYSYFKGFVLTPIAVP